MFTKLLPENIDFLLLLVNKFSFFQAALWRMRSQRKKNCQENKYLKNCDIYLLQYFWVKLQTMCLRINLSKKLTKSDICLLFAVHFCEHVHNKFNKYAYCFFLCELLNIFISISQVSLEQRNKASFSKGTQAFMHLSSRI